MYIGTEEKYNLYDKIVSATYANIFSLSKDKPIVLKDFYYSSGAGRTFLEVACMVAYITNKEIYVQSSWIDFIRARIVKKNKHIHWIRKNKKDVEGIEIYKVAAHEAVSFNQDINIFEEIFKAYYERKEA